MLRVIRDDSSFLSPVPQRPNAHLWKAVAPFVSLEEQLFAHDPAAQHAAAEAFVAASLPEANLTGRVA